MRKLTIASVVAALFLVSACGGDTEPTAEPTVKQSAPTEAVETPSPTASSAAPKQESLEAFAERWIAEWGAMQASGNTSPFRLMVTKRCEACTTFMTTVEEIYANGGWIKTKGSSVIKLSERRDTNNGVVVFLLTIDTKPTRLQRTPDSKVESLPGGTEYLRISAKKRSGTWLILDYLRASV